MTTIARATYPLAAFDETEALAAVQTSLRAALAAAPWPRALADVASSVLSEHTRALGGRLTPWALLPLCCCAAACGAWRTALPVAAACELYGTALDLLDDVEDGDSSDAVARHGAPIVLNLSSALLALAHTTLLHAVGEDGLPEVAVRRAQDALWQGLAVATGGQHLDLATAGGPPLTVTDCLDIARRKGGALTEACCRAGAAFGTADAALIERCGLLGRSIGLVGQLDNDMHDVENGAIKTDLVRHKQTVPIAVARASGHAGPLDEAVWRGGVQMAYALVHAERARVQEALEAVAAACPDPTAARAILELSLRPRGLSPVPAAVEVVA